MAARLHRRLLNLLHGLAEPSVPRLGGDEGETGGLPSRLAVLRLHAAKRSRIDGSDCNPKPLQLCLAIRWGPYSTMYLYTEYGRSIICRHGKGSIPTWSRSDHIKGFYNRFRGRRDQAARSRGSVMVKHVCPFSDSARIIPPCISMMDLVIASPRPTLSVYPSRRDESTR